MMKRRSRSVKASPLKNRQVAQVSACEKPPEKRLQGWIACPTSHVLSRSFSKGLSVSPCPSEDYHPSTANLQLIQSGLHHHVQVR